MTRNRPRQVTKAVWVLLLCFCLGLLASHALLNLVSAETGPKPRTAQQNAEYKAASNLPESQQENMATVLAISLPAPPPTRSARALEAPPLAERRSSVEVSPAAQPAPLIDTQDDTLIQQGWALLNNAQQAVPQIRINLPEEPRQQESVIQALRTCLGVTLGKLNEKGAVLAQEKTHQAVSPFLRLVEGPLSQQEQQLAAQWQDSPGTIVRFYPESADARVLGGLLQLVQGPLADKKITAEYRMQSGGLTLVNIEINGWTEKTILRLSKPC